MFGLRDPRQNTNPALSNALMSRYLEQIKQASSNKRIKLSSSSPCEVSELSQENGNTQDGNGNRSEQHSDNNFYHNSRPGSSDQSPLQSPRAPKTEVTSDTVQVSRSSVSVPNTMRFTSTHTPWPTVLNPQAAYQLQQQQNAIFQAVGDKNLKELAIFTGQHNDGQLLGYTPVSAAQINGNRAWPNIPAVVPLHNSNSNGEGADYQGIVAGERIPVPGLNPDEQLVAEERLFPPMPDAPGIPNGAKE